MKIKPFLFYTTLILFIFTVTFQKNLVDYDLFARLIQGQAFWQIGAVLKQDFLSYTQVHTWFDHEWGASAVFYTILKTFGSTGLLVLKASMISAIFIIILETIKLRGIKVSTPYNFMFFFIGFHAASMAGFTNIIRCQLFTYLFFVIWLYLLERVRIKGEDKWLLGFIPMMWIWANTHGGCAAGIGLLVLYALGEFLNKKPYKKYLYVLFGSCLVTIINPWGFDYVKFLAMATTMPRILIAEWQGTFAQSNIGEFLAFKTYLFIMLTLIGFRIYQKRKNLKNIDYTKALILAMMTYLSIRYTRHQPFFVITTLVFLYNDLYCILDKITAKLHLNTPYLYNIKEGLIYSLIALNAVSYFTLNKPQIHISNYKYPVKAVEFVKINGLKGNLLVNFHFGSYAAYKLYPNNLIAMDGRYEEVYPDYLLPMFNNFFMQAGENKNLLIEMFPPDIMIIDKEFEAEKAMRKTKKYKVAYDDETFTVFVEKSKSKTQYKQPPKDNQYYIDTMFDTDIDFRG